MSSEFWIGLLIQLVVYGVSIGAIYGTIKTRLNYIEAKLDKHNNVVERVYKFPSAGGVFGAAVIWYLKAVQLENGIKIQLGMIKKLIDLGEENPAEEIKERTIQKMKDKT